jgi:hypothetical protein
VQLGFGIGPDQGTKNQNRMSISNNEEDGAVGNIMNSPKLFKDLHHITNTSLVTIGTDNTE